MLDLHARALAAIALGALVVACSGDFGNTGRVPGAGDGGTSAGGGAGGEGGTGGTSATGGTSELGGSGGMGGGGGDGGAAPEPQQYAPCEAGDCWAAPSVTPPCGAATIDEDFSSGKYNVHEYPVTAPAKIAVDLTLHKTAGAWSPALLLRDKDGVILHDGEIASSTAALHIEVLSTGQGSGDAKVRVTATKATQLYLLTTSWAVIDSGFTEPMPQTAKYQLVVAGDCPEPPPGELMSPPNFDPNNKKNGYYLLPDSDPPGLYTHKADDCSRGTKLLIDVIYTVAVKWKKIHPELAPINVLDMNEGSCSTVDHATHDDGTHVDIIAGCATNVDCSDKQPSIDLAKLFVDTGKACGILNNNPPVQAVVNPYFESKYSYTPWKNTFMRSVSGHVKHFHVRVMKPDGLCN